MRLPANAALALPLVIAVVALIAIGPPGSRPVPAPPPPPAEVLPSISGGGITLTSAAIDLPADDAPFPAGPGSDVADRVCTACHSPSMILTQPPLTADQWTAEIEKMAKTYKAVIDPDDARRIHAYLVSLPPRA